MPVAKRGNAWQATVVHNKQRWRRSFVSKEEAAVWEADSRLRIKQGLTPEMTRKGRADETTGDGRPQTLQQLARLVYERHWRGKKSDRVVQLGLVKVVRILGPSTPIKNIRVSAIDKLRKHLFGRGVSSSTVNRHLSILSKMLRYAHECDWILSMPAVKREKEGQHRVRYLSAEEENLMLAWCRKRSLDWMERLIIVAVDTGLRKGELARINIRDFDEQTLVVPVSKSDKPRYIPLTRRACAALTAQADEAGHPHIFANAMQKRNLYDRWDSMRFDLGLQNDDQFVPHCMRHTFCSRLAMRGANAAMIRELAGHSTLMVSQRYIHLNMDALRSAISLLEKPDATNATVAL